MRFNAEAYEKLYPREEEEVTDDVVIESPVKTEEEEKKPEPKNDPEPEPKGDEGEVGEE